MASVSSTTSYNRLSGLATGLDTDAIVKSELQGYQKKIDTAKQEKEIIEIRQKLYRDIIGDIRSFNDKYLDVLSNDSLLMSKNFANVSFESSDTSIVTATSISGAKADNYNVKVDHLAKKAEVIIKDDDLKASDKIKISYLGKDYDIDIPAIDSNTSMSDVVNKINEQFKSLNLDGLKVEYSQFSKGLKIESVAMGGKIGTEDNKIVVKTYKSGAKIKDIEGLGQNASVTIINSSKKEYKYTGNTNKLLLDGIQFEFNGESGTDSTKLTGKIDTKNVKDRIVNFVNDYNTLIEKLNKATNTKHSRDYKPLTSAQKEAMSEKEIELWNAKVEEGQLYRDSDLTRITNALKESMRNVMSDGLSLKSIGIEPVKDYTGNKNGTFSIDEKKLTAALEDNIDGVMNLFTANPKSSSTNSSASSKGIIVQLKDMLKDELASDSVLSKKIGYEGTSTFSNNTFTKNISDYENKIKDMNSDLSRRQQLLYSKYASLEKMMNKFNSQQSYLMSYFGS